MKRLYPSSLRPQGVEIVRTWAFYTIYRSGVGLTGKKPWETILLNGNVLATDGKKMSKSLGNIISPSELQRDYPTDAIRQWSAMSGAMAKDRPFSYEDIRYAKSFLNKVWNAAKFVETAAEGYDCKIPDFGSLSIIDKWMVSRMNQTISEYTERFEKFEYQHAIGILHNFFWHDFCDNYLEYVKHRIYGADASAKSHAQYVLRYVLLNTIKLLAPVAPHITEEIYFGLFSADAEKDGSLYLSKWPAAGNVDDSAMSSMASFNTAISEIRKHKASSQIAQNAELEQATLVLPEPMPEELINELKSVAKIKSVTQKNGSQFGITF